MSEPVHLTLDEKIMVLLTDNPLTLIEINEKVGGFNRTLERRLNTLIGLGKITKFKPTGKAREKLLRGKRGTPPYFYIREG